MANNAFILLINAINNVEEQNRNRVLKRHLRDMSDPLDMPENQFRCIYRLSRDMVFDLVVSLGPHIRDGEREGIFIPKELKIMVALNFFAHGSYQKAVGQNYFIAMSQSSVSRCIAAVNVALETMYYKIHFPINEEERAVIKQGFMQGPNAFPGIIGAVDGTQVAITAPSINNEYLPPLVFYNRKGFYSINIQIICDANLKIMAVNARYPGSVHDAAIWTTSQIRQLLQDMYAGGDHSSWLIGDSGYPLEPWLMTPVVTNNLTVGEQNYNQSHKSTRNVVERTIGVSKGRFRCLLKHRALHYCPLVAAKIVYSCSVLHNMCVERGGGEDIIYNEIVLDDEDINNIGPANVYINNQGRLTRNRIIRTYFN